MARNNATPNPPTATPPQPWDQQPGEPNRWFDRFQIYLSLGPTRTCWAAYCTVSHIDPHSRPANAPPGWQWHAKTWRWRARAHAWDVYQRSLLALGERNARLALHWRRVEVMEDTLETIRAALDTADIAGAGQQQAREWLPELRVFLRDMLVAQRQEFERLDDLDHDEDGPLAITADDLRAAARELERDLDRQPASPFTPQAARCGYKLRPERGAVLAVCLGDAPRLQLDLAPLHVVRAASGLQYVRILNATRGKLARYIRRERSFDRPVELLHLGLRASAAGVEFTDRLADGDWLRQRLQGVRVLLLACSQSEDVGDWPRVVPHVVSLRQEASPADAALFAQHFWQGIGLGQDPAAVLAEALRLCPPALHQFVTGHW